jgi:hypothetical protein
MRRNIRTSIAHAAVFAGLAAAAAPAAAQHTDHAAHAGHGAHAGGQFPEGWQGRVDRENQNLTDVRFMAMGDAFHVITGPHVILWQPDHTATGEFRASVTYTQRRAPERPESYGLLVGGVDLDAPDQDYLYFMIRHDGRYLIRHRMGDEVHTLAEWTESPAVRQATADASGENTLAIEARADRVHFVVNGTTVQSFDRVPMLNTNGIVGVRVGHNLDVHFRDLTVTPLDP